MRKMNSNLRGGKTPPRLLNDLSLYNPQHLPPNSYNVLTELALQFAEGVSPLHRASDGICRHIWALKERQSILPRRTARGETASAYHAAACCPMCRLHLEMAVEAPAVGVHTEACPNDITPLHHFIYSPRSSPGFQWNADDRNPGSWMDVQQFICSSPSCCAKLTIRLQSPRLSQQWVALLLDKTLISKRAQQAMVQDPERFEGHAVPSPTQVLLNLKTYITNAVTNSNPRPIAVNNKKWLLCLGETCAELLQYLGFTRLEEDWMPPRPDVMAASPLTNPLNITLDDVELELLVLLSQQPDDEIRLANAYFRPVSADLDFQRLLHCDGYKKSLSSRTIGFSKAEEHPYYAALGTTMDFNDDLIIFGYEKQISIDHSNEPYYLECLQGIAMGRKSETLQTRTAIEASAGKISTKDIQEAYKSLDLDPHDTFLDEDTVIGTFQSRVADAPRQESELRQALRVIGQARGSTRIQHVASNSVTTYEQALAWLTATEDTEDAFVISMYAIKVTENAANQGLARACVKLVAEKRNSAALVAWLKTGELGEDELDIGQAFARLGIDDRTIDDELILTTYNLRAQDTPGQLESLKRALMAIATDRDSQYLKTFLGTGFTNTPHPLSEWPVGLENIGNTCYLNSLLQFYFTIKPLRDLVLDFDEHKAHTDDPKFEQKQVGSRRVSRKEVERAQRFMYELQKLFRSMINEPRADVTPEHELARLTLISSFAEESIRRQSVLSAHRSSLGNIKGIPIQGPMLSLTPNSTHAAMSEGDVETSGVFNTPKVDDESSEGTLVEVPVTGSPEDGDFMIIDVEGKHQKQVQKEKEAIKISGAADVYPITSDFHVKPAVELLSLSHSDEQQKQDQVQELNKKNETSDCIIPGTSGPPTRPPPIPPRQKSKEHKTAAIQEEVEIGAQQDVTEVIANVLFQLQCAVKAESIDESGEQIDQIKNLFFGKQKSYTTNEWGVIRNKEEFISDIKIDVASGPRDIYGALDGAFDVQEVEVGGSLEPQYATISQLPPILQILVQRAQFDPKRKTTFKSNHHLELKETIYMDRYMDSSDAELAQRRQICWEWKKELAELDSRRAQFMKTEVENDVPSLLNSSLEYFQQLVDANADDRIIADRMFHNILQDATTDVTDELLAINHQIRSLTSNINSQFVDFRNLPYRLHSVFIHRGMVNSGHYWIYIHDFERNIWRKYNDAYVTEVKDVKEIYEAEPGNRPATPYFLVYIKEDLINLLVDAVCRDLADDLQNLHADAQGDISMKTSEKESANSKQRTDGALIVPEIEQEIDEWEFRAESAASREQW